MGIGNNEANDKAEADTVVTGAEDSIKDKREKANNRCLIINNVFISGTANIKSYDKSSSNLN